MAYNAIYPYIRMRLRNSAADLLDTDFDPEIASVIRKVLQPYNITYGSVAAGNDLDNLNEAVGLLVCARLITPLSTDGLNFDVNGEKTETASINLAIAPGGDQKSTWIAEARAALSLISFVMMQQPDLVTFAVNGRRRTWDRNRFEDGFSCD